jgi:uroporphyrinogen decarboxylase
MNSRQRILDALSYKETERIPVDFSGHRSSGIAAVLYGKLKKALGITSGNIYIYDMVQQLAIVEEPVLDTLKIDTVEMGRGFCLDEKDWKDWVLPDGTPCKIPYYIHVEKKGPDWYIYNDAGQELGVQKEGCWYFEQTYFPLADRDPSTENLSDLDDILGNTIWTGVVHPGAHIEMNEKGLQEMATGAKTLRESTDRAVMGLFGGNMFEIPQFLFRMDNYLMYMGLYPDLVHRLSEKLCTIHLKNIEKWLGAVGPYIDIIVFGDDLGSNTGPLISPDMYKEYYKPYHKKMWDLVKKMAPHVKINLHSCGGIEPFLEDLIDAGLDAINPVQVSANTMDPTTLKNKYHGHITFWGGGCDTQQVLPNGTPDEVKKHTKEMLNIWSPGGGFVFQQVHNMMANVPVENILAMFETIDRHA